MAKSFTFYKMGIAFWLLSLILFFSGVLIILAHAMYSITLILTAIATLILGGLSIIYAELKKSRK